MRYTVGSPGVSFGGVARECWDGVRHTVESPGVSIGGMASVERVELVAARKRVGYGELSESVELVVGMSWTYTLRNLQS